MRKYVLIGLVFAGIGSFFVWNQTSSVKTEYIAQVVKPTTPSVTINKLEIPVEVMRTEVEVQKGLSGRLSLGSKNGMLFIFNIADYYRFWMPDMHFPIDIIWINNNKIIDISHNVSNKLDPSKPKFYLPTKKANYVLEVNAGFSKKNNIKIGDSVFLNNVK
ncbi:MAG: DUF192 domain-containing protein [bacterium]|nr:DUF192 domain-containing protein [bacterium]